jgi:hypothetical protein
MPQKESNSLLGPMVPVLQGYALCRPVYMLFQQLLLKTPTCSHFYPYFTDIQKIK